VSSIILGLLVVAALYSGTAYLAVTISALQHGSALSYERRVQVELETFHLGLCFIAALGFLGVLLK
jgi:hypothetical protein